MKAYNLFFFLIGKQKSIINEKKRKSTSCSWWWTRRNKRTNSTTKKRNQETKLREAINSERVEQSVKPQQRDHSNRLRWHNTFSSSNVFSLSSKEWRFRSNYTIHIKHPGTKFQMSELRFPSHWCQQDNKPTTDPGIIQWIPKAWIIKVHRE